MNYGESTATAGANRLCEREVSLTTRHSSSGAGAGAFTNKAANTSWGKVEWSASSQLFYGFLQLISRLADLRPESRGALCEIRSGLLNQHVRFSRDLRETFREGRVDRPQFCGVRLG